MSDLSAPRMAESAHDLLGPRVHPLDAFFHPQTVAVIGATETAGSVGRTTLWNLMSTPFGGTVFPVNPKRPSVLGIKAYPSVKDVPAKVDLAVVVSPAATVPGVLRECGEAGVRAAIVISAGFKEMGPAGEALEQQVRAVAQEFGIRIIGPNCLGLMNPISRLNATFARATSLAGSVGFLSQSGALCTAVLDWSLKEKVGFSAFVSLGSMTDISWGDLIDYLGNDPNTRSILIYMETVGDARAFLSAAREVALSKPIIIIKAGRTAAGGQAAASHTGSLTGSDDVLDAAFRRCGVLRVNNISDLFYMAEVLAKQPRPRGPRLTILTNAGGPAVLATDALVSEGAELALLAPETIAALDEFLPPSWSHANPIDILGDAGADRYAKALEIAAKDPNSDGLLVVLTPQAMTDATGTASLLRPYAHLPGKPVLASWMGGPEIAAGEEILNSAGIPTFSYPDTAARAFQYMWAYSRNLKALYETPESSAAQHINREKAADMLASIRAEGRTILTEYESKRLLREYCIQTTDTRVARNSTEAVNIAEQMGYPVVLKLHSLTITHKTDVGGVQLNLRNALGVKQAYANIEHGVRTTVGLEHFQGVTVQPMAKLDGYELIIGSSIDPQFGPVLLFGFGGQLVEVFQDRALALPPLTRSLARRLMEGTRIYHALQGVRGRPPVDLADLEATIVRFSQLVVEHPSIKEIDINPLLAGPRGVLALDARVLLHDPSITAAQLPRPAIRPYPSEYITFWNLPTDNTPVTIRPIRPEDEPMLVRFHETLSDRSVYLRYLQAIKLSSRVAHERLIRICFNDYDRELALVAEIAVPGTTDHQIVGVSRLVRASSGPDCAEIALIVSDAYHGRGLGAELLGRLIAVARQEKIGELTATILSDNIPMQHLCRKLGFQLEFELEDNLVTARLPLMS